MRVFLAILTAILLGCPLAMGQGRTGIVVGQKKGTGTSGHATTATAPKTTAATKKAKGAAAPWKKPAKPDTVYSHSTRKRNGWFEPRGIITREQVAHREKSYMFTGRNEKGHWTKMETINAKGEHTVSGMSPYIANLYSDADSLINQDWAQSLQGSCVFEFIPDATGDNIVQERAYGGFNNLLYAFSSVPTVDGQGNIVYVGSYKNLFGLPAEMRLEEGYAYGTLVTIIRTKEGYDEVIQSVDAKGVPKPNSDGAYERFTRYDSEGRELQILSRDINGRNMLDEFGNCGQVLEWDEETNLILTATYTDEDLNPIKVYPSFMGPYYGVMKVKYGYDEYFNTTSQQFVTLDNRPTTNFFGCAGIELKFDDNGFQSSMRGFDLDGNTVPIDQNGVAEVRTVYDSDGRLLEVTRYDGGLNLISRDVSAYDDNGLKTAERYYDYPGGEERELGNWVSTVIDGKKLEGTRDADGNTWICGYDEEGNQTREIYTDGEGNPTASPSGWSVRSVEFDRLGNGRVALTEKWFGPDLLPFGQREMDSSVVVDTREQLIDTVAGTILSRGYENGILRSTEMKKFDHNFGEFVYQEDVNRFGVGSRAGGSSGVRHYRAHASFSTLAGGSDGTYITSLVGQDEFDEPDYILPNVTPPYFYQRFTKGGSRFHLEHDEPVLQTRKQLLDSLPKLITLEIIDSIGYRYGLRDNDVVIRYGDYVPDLTFTEDENDFTGRWTVRKVLDSDRPREMVVFRVEDGPANKYGLVSLELPAGKDADLGFAAHTRVLTDRQKRRILDCIAENPLYAPLLDKREEERRTHLVTLAFPPLYLNELLTFYPASFGEAGILLGYYDGERLKKRNGEWDLLDVLTDELEIGMLPRVMEGPERRFYVTTDGQSVIEGVRDDMISGLDWTTSLVTQADHERLQRLYDRAAERMDSIDRLPPMFPVKDLAGRWEVTGDSIGEWDAQGYLLLKKDGTCEGNLSGLTMIMPDTFWDLPGGIIFRQHKDWKGRWHVSPRGMLVSEPENEATYECIYYSESSDPETLENINELCSRNASNFVGRMNVATAVPDFVKIASVGKDSLVLSIADDYEITLRRTRK